MDGCVILILSCYIIKFSIEDNVINNNIWLYVIIYKARMATMSGYNKEIILSTQKSNLLANKKNTC